MKLKKFDFTGRSPYYLWIQRKEKKNALVRRRLHATLASTHTSLICFIIYNTVHEAHRGALPFSNFCIHHKDPLGCCISIFHNSKGQFTRI